VCMCVVACVCVCVCVCVCLFMCSLREVGIDTMQRQRLRYTPCVSVCV